METLSTYITNINNQLIYHSNIRILENHNKQHISEQIALFSRKDAENLTFMLVKPHLHIRGNKLCFVYGR